MLKYNIELLLLLKIDNDIQRLIGKAIVDEKTPETGKTWVVYINNTKHSWDHVCKTDQKVHPQDKIIWSFQLFDEQIKFE